MKDKPELATPGKKQLAKIAAIVAHEPVDVADQENKHLPLSILEPEVIVPEKGDET